MSQPGSKRIALIVDDDLGFVWWLGEILTELGYQAVPALNCPKALFRIQELGLNVDVLIVDLKLDGVPEMIAALRQSHPLGKLIVIGKTGPEAIAGMQVAAALEKPALWKELSREEWVQNVRLIIERPQRTA